MCLEVFATRVAGRRSLARHSQDSVPRPRSGPAVVLLATSRDGCPARLVRRRAPAARGTDASALPALSRRLEPWARYRDDQVSVRIAHDVELGLLRDRSALAPVKRPIRWKENDRVGLRLSPFAAVAGLGAAAVDGPAKGPVRFENEVRGLRLIRDMVRPDPVTARGHGHTRAGRNFAARRIERRLLSGASERAVVDRRARDRRTAARTVAGAATTRGDDESREARADDPVHAHKVPPSSALSSRRARAILRPVAARCSQKHTGGRRCRRPARAWRETGRPDQAFFRFSSTKSQFTRLFRNVSMYFGRAFR